MLSDLRNLDWGSVVRRRYRREPVEKGGWSVFHTWFTGGFILNPVVTTVPRTKVHWDGSGWYDNPKIEQLTQEWLDAQDEDGRKKIAATIPVENYRRSDVHAGSVPDPCCIRQEPHGQAGIHRPAVLGAIRRVTRTAARSGSGGVSCGIRIGGGGSSIGTGSSGSGQPRRSHRAASVDRTASFRRFFRERRLDRRGCHPAAAPRVRGSARSTGRCPATRANTRSRRPVTSYSHHS